jgi:hypothetical protein
MIRFWGFALLTAGVLAGGLTLDEAAAADDKKEGEVVEIDGMKAAVPGSWVSEKPKNRLRWKTFKLPKAKDDKMDAELAMFNEAAGKPEDNVKRWKGMFQPPEGKTIDDVSKVTEIMIGKGKATYLEVYGTYLFKEFPMAPKAEMRPDHKMIAVQYDGGDNTYHFRITGPAATVDAHKKGFDDWLKALKK